MSEKGSGRKLLTDPQVLLREVDELLAWVDHYGLSEERHNFLLDMRAKLEKNHQLTHRQLCFLNFLILKYNTFGGDFYEDPFGIWS